MEVGGDGDSAVFIQDLHGICDPIIANVCVWMPSFFRMVLVNGVWRAGISMKDGVEEAAAVVESMGSGDSAISCGENYGGIGRGSDNVVVGVSKGGGVDPSKYGGGTPGKTGEGSRIT